MMFKDGRQELPRHETKTFSRRSIEDIKGIVVHQTAGRDNPVNTARYHCMPNHVAETGCPGLLYSFYIRKSGEIWWANDLEAVTWSQGGHGSPVPGLNANKNFLAIVLGGDFSSDGYEGDDGHPTVDQLHALLNLTQHLTGSSEHPALPTELFDALPDCASDALWGHKQFGKQFCPGFTAQAMVDGIRHHWNTEEPWDATRWQKALSDAGYDIVADGVWGPMSKGTLVEFQRDKGLTTDGVRGPLTQAALMQGV